MSESLRSQDRALRRRARRTYIVLATLGLAVALASLAFGQGSLGDAELRATFIGLRATRLLSALIVGACLAAGGAAMQGLLRNPLVSPSILGTTSGASLGGQLVILALQSLPRPPMPIAEELLLPLGCFAGALLSLLVLLAVVRRKSDTVVFLLVGFILSSLFLALGGFITSLSQDKWDLGRAVVAFTLGGLEGAGLRLVLLVSPLAVFGIAAVWFFGRPLDLLLSGEQEAASLGVEVPVVQRWVVVWTAVLTAAAVAIGGNVAFVGLIVPHALRPLVGTAHRGLAPASALGGAVFVAACDLAARLAPGRTEIPLGVVTGIIGAPLFLVLLLRARRGATCV